MKKFIHYVLSFLKIFKFKQNEVQQNNTQDNAEYVQELTLRAEQGDAEAQASLGRYLYKGIYGTQSYVEAIKWFTKAAEQGHAEACLYLAVIYHEGQGIEKNCEEARKWFQLAEEIKAEDEEDEYLRYTEILFTVGYRYYEDKNYSEAVKWFTKAAEQGLAEACLYLAVIYHEGQGIEKNCEEARKWFQLAEEIKAEDEEDEYCSYPNKHTEILFTVGYRYYEDKNYSEAVKWLKLGVEFKVLNAKALLAYMYYKGLGVEKNYNDALNLVVNHYDDDNPDEYYWPREYDHYSRVVNWYTNLRWKLLQKEHGYKNALKLYNLRAEQGDADAQFSLGFIYSIEKSTKKALKWFKLAAEQGHAEAQFRLGEYYKYKKHNRKKGDLWFKLAAEQGHIDAQMNLVDFINLAAEQGHVVACYELGRMNYFDDDYQEAYKWYMLAAEHGFPPAQLMLSYLLYESSKEESEKWQYLSEERDYHELLSECDGDIVISWDGDAYKYISKSEYQQYDDVSIYSYLSKKY